MIIVIKIKNRNTQKNYCNRLNNSQMKNDYA